jgi:hypothetical protein
MTSEFMGGYIQEYFKYYNLPFCPNYDFFLQLKLLAFKSGKK